ncbi:MAG: hypothetical protein J4F36_09250 [Nitrosopumilaceae archaeon]|nr:hypothetical protein [Nitrosopumilaceae archaeon]
MDAFANNNGYSTGAHTANLWTQSGSNIYYNAGNVGIGTSSPERTLHIQGDVIRLDRDGNSPGVILTRWDGGYNNIWKSFIVGSDASGVNDGSFFIGDYGTATGGPTTKRLVIDNDGNVGIGTSSPNSLLEINGYIELDTSAGTPPSADCNAADEIGRMKMDSANDNLYVCSTNGWQTK